MTSDSVIEYLDDTIKSIKSLIEVVEGGEMDDWDRKVAKKARVVLEGYENQRKKMVGQESKEQLES